MTHRSWFNDAHLQHQLDKLMHSHATRHNSGTLLINGGASFKQRKKNIESADVILLKSFEFHEDETGKAMIALLLQKAKQGAKIFIQVDVYGFFDRYEDLHKILNGKMSPIPAFMQPLLDQAPNNVFILPTNIPMKYSAIVYGFRFPKDHEKFLITWKHHSSIEPVKVIMGGINVGDSYAFPGQVDAEGRSREVPSYLANGSKKGAKNAYGLRDTDIEVTGPVTHEVVKEFLRAMKFHNHNQNAYFKEHLQPNLKRAIEELTAINAQMEKHAKLAFPATGDVTMRLIPSPPHQTDKCPPMMDLFKLLLKHVPEDTKVIITTAFFLPTKEILDLLLKAVAKGVTFDFIVNDHDVGDGEIATVSYAAYAQISTILPKVTKNNLRFHKYIGNKEVGTGSIHQKAFSIGSNENDPFFLTSSNFDANSLNWNSESGLLIQCPRLKKQFDDALHDDLRHSQPLTMEELKNRPMMEKIKGHFLSKYFVKWL